MKMSTPFFLQYKYTCANYEYTERCIRSGKYGKLLNLDYAIITDPLPSNVDYYLSLKIMKNDLLYK